MPRDKTIPRFAMCIQNDGYSASLERCKVYRVIPDDKAVALGLLRILDESGEDYLFPEDRFVMLKLPLAAAVVVAGKTRRTARART